MWHLAAPANFGSLSREYPHSPSVNQCFLSIFDPTVAGSLVIRFDAQAQQLIGILRDHWGN